MIREGAPKWPVGIRVRVMEPGIRPWEGEVIAQKWSFKSGWHYEVRDAEMIVRSVGDDMPLEVIS